MKINATVNDIKQEEYIPKYKYLNIDKNCTK